MAAKIAGREKNSACEQWFAAMRLARPAEHAIPHPVDAQPRAPRSDHPGDRRTPRRRAPADVGVEDGERAGDERPGCVGEAGALQAEMAYPQRGHNDRGESPASGRKRKDRCNGRRHAPVS